MKTTPIMAIAFALTGCGGSGGVTNPPPNPPPVFTGADFEGSCRYYPDPYVTCRIVVEGESATYYEQSGTGGVTGTFRNGVLHAGPYNTRVNLEWTGSAWRMWIPGRLEVAGL